jgi:V/A-type H+-transporting ATPase subunit K
MKYKPMFVGAVVVLSILAAGLISMNGLAERVPQVDMDHDGMDDQWELSLVDEDGNPVTNITEFLPFEDEDEDGMTNLEEYLEYTNPFLNEDSKVVKENRMLVFIGVALAMGVAAIMSSIGIGIAGAGATGVAAERPDKFGRLIVYQALPMTQGIYGLLIAILVLNFTGLTGGINFEVLRSPYVGWGALSIGIVIAFSSVSAIPQGMTASAAAAAFGRNNKVYGQGVIFAVMSETMAIFGFLVAIFLLLASGMLG